ncbi:hypothetical protein CYMTET_31353 [Cymbomonas tetramitiformis]|uniref:Uncharacterized protein n=1 Tax=Cymbomonas tetramitiformis TaxID=36881 RepID=A0AAE0FHN0_9CHLO|nr:hypothetical protein CYMTET_31353 [Cymbomonas tetramitiformis]
MLRQVLESVPTGWLAFHPKGIGQSAMLVSMHHNGSLAIACAIVAMKRVVYVELISSRLVAVAMGVVET